MTAIAKGFFDDSKSDGQALAIAGYMGTSYAWEVFESAWSMVLSNHSVPYFHMREMNDPDGPFAKWLPHSEHRQEVADFFGDLASAIKVSGITGFCSLVRIKDLDHFNEEFGLDLEAYPLAVYGCMIVVARHFLTMPVEIIFDRIEKLESKLAKAKRLADTDSYNSDVFDRIVTMPLPKGITFRTVPALQAADYYVWEFRKGHLNISDWFDLPKSGKRDEWWRDFKEWSLKRFGKEDPTTRRSADALMDGQYFDYLIWDLTNLREAHELRKGVWP